MKKILIVQTAFIGDVVLALPLAQVLRAQFPNAEIHFLLRKGNENLLDNHPAIDKTLVFDKKNKFSETVRLLHFCRNEKYDTTFNLQRFFTSGFLTVLSGAKSTIGFDKNPLSWLYSTIITHTLPRSSEIKIENWEQKHEVDRNLDLLLPLKLPSEVLARNRRPRLYPSDADRAHVEAIVGKSNPQKPYLVIAPTSVWFTKQFPNEKWVEFLHSVPEKYAVFLVGGPNDLNYCDKLIEASRQREKNPLSVKADPSVSLNLCGKITFLQTAALMEGAKMVFANDSAPLHFASAVNAPVTGVFCSTLPEFGFGPLSDESRIVQTHEILNCRPCGLHGKSNCPEGHFRCAKSIFIGDLLDGL